MLISKRCVVIVYMQNQSNYKCRVFNEIIFIINY
jgi:hypothetical protein